MASIPTQLLVVALALSDESGRLLLQQRPAHKHHGGLWELPGGKVESGESPRMALCREIEEELGILLNPGDLSPSLAVDDGADGSIVMIVYTCSVWRGNPEGREGQQWGWFTRSQALELPLPPMDQDLLKRMPE